MNYIIAMNFISYTLAIWMLLGYGFIKSCESDLKNPNSTLDDQTRMNVELWIQDYNGRNWAGRVAFTITMGARMMAFIFRKGA